MDIQTNCVFCEERLDGGKLAVVSLREKSSASINQASQQRNDSIKTVPRQQVHQDCRTYCNPIKIAQTNKKDLTKPMFDHSATTLKFLLGEILVGNCIGVKLASIGQAIMQAARPRMKL